MGRGKYCAGAPRRRFRLRGAGGCRCGGPSIGCAARQSRSRPCSTNWRAWGHSGTPGGGAGVGLRPAGRLDKVHQPCGSTDCPARCGCALPWEVNVHEFPPAGGEVDGGAAVGDFDLAPGPMHVEEDEEVGRPIALILAVEALKLTRLGLDRLADLANQLSRALVETDHWALRIGRLSIEVEHILHAGDELAVDLRDAPHVLAPGLELVFGQTPAYCLTGD